MARAREEAARLEFYVNGHHVTVEDGVDGSTPLLQFLRSTLQLKGTKSMCREGACGACLVTMTRLHPVTKEEVTFSINSCLTPLIACHGTSLTTVEGLGNRATGYAIVQATLARCNGTQCGFCSPGMVINMHSLLKNKENVSMKDVEDSFGGNFCRCTGYRPILDAFKAISSDATFELKEKIADIEDIWKIKKDCENSKCQNGAGCFKLSAVNQSLFGKHFIIPQNIKELLNILEDLEDDYTLVAGNTAQGVFQRTFQPSYWININNIKELTAHKITNDSIELGANMSLSDVIDLFEKLSNEKRFHFLQVLIEHLLLVANVPVRNTGTLAGNLMIKHDHPEFPSDIFVILETINATIITVTAGEEKSITPVEFLKLHLKRTILKKIVIPILSADYKLRTFKVMPRAQNVYAHVNSGFLFRLSHDGKVIERPNIVYGGITRDFVHTTRTEEFFSGNNIFDQNVFKKGLSILNSEVNPTIEGFQASTGYRKKLAIHLFYKFVLSLSGDRVTPAYRSGGAVLERPISKGMQSYETVPERWPFTKPLVKTEALIQCSGEAEYVNDIPEAKDQLYGSLVLASQAGAEIESIDATPALKIPGMVAFFSARDIPGKNVFSLKKNPFGQLDEELFCSGKVQYAGQPLGVLIASTEQLAAEGASKVAVHYNSPSQTPVFNVKQVLDRNLTSRITHFESIKPEEENINGDSQFELRGELETTAQYHFTMEPQSASCTPCEDGLVLHSATQWIYGVQSAVSAALNIPENSINMEVRRLGGGFGSKITRSGLVATACALAAHLLQRPVKIVLDLKTNMKAIGKRNASYSKYHVGFNGSGLIDWLKVWSYGDMGCSLSDPCNMLVEPALRNCYESKNWEMNIYSVVTDVPASSWMRAPGTIESMPVIEEVMEHIAFTLKKDPLDVRLRNIGDKFSPILKMISQTLEDSNYSQRRKSIEEFNENNRWRKRGISFVPMAFSLEYFFSLNSMVSIYGHDGTVSITHGGIEMGQGVNTKAIQACAATLGVDVSKIKVKPSSSLTSPNACLSGASITSDCVVYSTIKCCEILNERLKNIKEKMKGAKWEDIIYEAYSEDINLNASYLDNWRDKPLLPYYVYATAVTEVEVDILTGQHQVQNRVGQNVIILRTDILEDAGESLSPEIDIGQVEGGFVMGLGYFLLEDIVIDQTTGITTSNNTATYWVPGAKDIPIDFRVSLLKGNPNPYGIARSKATGEPPICLALSALFAKRNAILSARHDLGQEDWLPFCQPLSVEKTCLAVKTSLEDLHF